MPMMFKRRRVDSSAFFGVLTHGSLDEFDAIYDASMVNLDFDSGTPLTLALSNGDLSARVAIASRLLDDGASVSARHPLHVLANQNTHDFEAEAALLRRMMDLGADVNSVTPRTGTPLEAAASVFRFSDDALSPFYDAFLARPEVDLLAPGLDGRPVLVNLRKWAALRPVLVQRAETLLRDRGQHVAD